LSSLSHNIRVLAFRSVVLTISGGLAGGLSALYVKQVLGADGVVLGLISSIWSGVYLVFILIGGSVGDYHDRKKMLLLGTALTLPNPIIYALAPSWQPLLIANFLGALGSAFANPAYTGILYASVEQKERSRQIATINTLTGFANVVFPPLGAYLVQWMGGLDEIRNIFLLQTLFSVGVWLYTLKALESKPLSTQEEPKSLKNLLREVFHQMKDVYRITKERKATPWLYMSLTGPFAWELVGPFWTIYAAEVCGSPFVIIGLLSTVSSLTAILLQIPIAGIADRKGRRRTILAVRPFGTSAGPSWSAAQTEVMPESYQGRWSALQSFLWRATAIPASLMGGLLWNIDPRLPFIIALAVDGLVRFPILIRHVPETLVPSGRTMPAIGPSVVIYGLPEAGRTSTARLVQRTMCVGEVCPRIIDEGVPTPGRISEVLASEKEPVIVEGKTALYAASKAEESVRVLLYASKEERVRRKARRSKKPDFVALREVEEEDREVSRITRRLYRADMSKMPPFDVAINTERVPADKVAKIISILREEEEEKDSADS